VVDPDDPGADIDRIVADSTESYRVEEPVQGTWKARVEATPPNVQESVSTQPGADITDYSTTTSTLEIGSDFTIDKMIVDMGITHERASDLRVTLRSPSGTACDLHRYTAGTANGIEGEYPLTLDPHTPLSVFRGENAQGTWRLDVYDGSGADVGTLDSWGLEFFTGIRDEAAFDLRLYSTGTLLQVTPGVSDPDVGYPEPVVLSVSVVAGNAVTGADVSAHVEGPDGDTLSLPMFDDGDPQHGDPVAEDGTYATRFSSFTVNGTYRVRIDVNNERGYAAPALMEDGPYSDTPIKAFRRSVTQEFRVTGVPTVSRRRLRVDTAKLVQGRAEKDSLKLKGRVNCSAGTMNPDEHDLTLRFGTWELVVPAGTMKRKGNRDKWTYNDGAAKLVLDLFRGGSSLGRMALKLKKTDLDGAVDTRFPVLVQLSCGGFDQTIRITMEANEDPATGGVFRIGANNVTPTDVYVDVFSVKRSKKAGKDKLVAVLRHPGVTWSPETQPFTLRLGTVELPIPAGALEATKKDGVFKGTIVLDPEENGGGAAGETPIPPPDDIVPRGTLKILVDTNQRTIRIVGKHLNLSDVPNPAILDLIFGFATYRAQIRFAEKKRTLVY
jgi:subtilisin-like proprotein convertase family protein